MMDVTLTRIATLCRLASPDEHLKTLEELFFVYSERSDYTKRVRATTTNANRRYAAALLWVIDQNAYGVTDDEVVG